MRFLNREGGKILLGVKDDKTVIGVDDSSIESILKSISDNSNNLQILKPPHILFPSVHQIDGKNIILVDIPRSSQVHLHKK